MEEIQKKNTNKQTGYINKQMKEIILGHWMVSTYDLSGKPLACV